MVNFEVLTGDCLEQMQNMEAASVDAVITDPPYAGFGFNGSPKQYWEQFRPFYEKMKQVCKSETQISLSVLPQRLNLFAQQMNLHQGLMIPNAFEDQRGIKALFILHESLKVPKPHPESWAVELIPRSIHPNPRDINKMAIVVKALTQEGDIVLDPFCGSGAIGIACLLLNRHFVGIELLPERAEDASQRLEYVQAHKQAILRQI